MCASLKRKDGVVWATYLSTLFPSLKNLFIDLFLKTKHVRSTVAEVVLVSLTILSSGYVF